MRRRLGALALAALAAGCGGLDGAGYLVRAGWSEARILCRREPIPALLARPDLDRALRARLELVLAVRAFAADALGLRVGESYTTFAEVDRDATVHVLSAAHRDRLEAYLWWYPIVGRLPYRGFFDREAAERAGRRLEARGLDVEVRPAVAFSTLGWFADPLLSTAAAGPAEEVAATVLHELLHATLYVPGAAVFNESLASFVGHRGAIAFFAPDGPGADAARWAAARRRWEVVLARGRVFAHLARCLRRLYASGARVDTRARLRRWLAGQAGAALARRRVGRADELLPPNNARLLGKLLYTTGLDAFDALAPTDPDLRPALAALVRRARGAEDPFAVVAALATRGEGR